MHPPPPPPQPDDHPGRCAPSVLPRAGRRVWPPDLWDPLLSSRGCPPSSRRKAELQPGQRAWAYDLPRAHGLKAGAPKRYLSASVAQFEDIYLAIGAPNRHAYELLEHRRACHLFFDLDGSCDGSGTCEKIANCIAEEAAGVLLDLVAARAPALLTDGVRVLTLALDSAHGGSKFSRHLLLQVVELSARVAWRFLTLDVTLTLIRTLQPRRQVVGLAAGCTEPLAALAGLATAHALAAQVVARCERRGVPAAELVDFAVYRKDGCFRMLASSKLAGDAQAPLRLTTSASSQQFGALDQRQLLRASLVQLAQKVAQVLAYGTAALPRAPSTVAGASGRSYGEGAVGMSAQSPVAPHERVRWQHLTRRPLLETPRLVPRQHSTARRSGRGAPPPPFDRLARWGAAQLRRLGCPARGSGIAAGGAGAVIASWLVQVLEGELLLRLIPWAGGLCACRGREHRSNSVLLSIDLSTGEAFQQCFDRQCIMPRNGGHVVASTPVGVAGAGCLPARSAVQTWVVARAKG